MRIALAQLNYHIGNFDANTAKIISAVERAKAHKAELVIFAELAVCGYPPRDFLEFPEFVEACIQSVKKVAEHCHGISAIIGAPSFNPEIQGKSLFNSAYYVAEGKIQSVFNKGLLPNYDVFDEYRYFEPGKNFRNLHVNGKKVALTICEDIWDIEEDLMYTVCPMDVLKKDQPLFMINIAASPFSYTHPAKRKDVLSKNSKDYGLPLFYVNHIGAQTELIFDGGSMVMNEGGEIIDELNYFSEDFRLYDVITENAKEGKLKIEKVLTGDQISFQEAEEKSISEISLIHDGLVLGLKDYFRKMGFKSGILGLSGGIDSAVVLCLAASALGKENIHSVLLPSEFSTSHSVEDSIKLAENLGSSYEIMPIKNIYGTSLQTLSQRFAGTPFGLAEENLQARIRGILLMSLSNKFGNILLNTSNKSELAVGYGTLYGDMCGGLSVIGDVYKTQVYDLARYINRDKEIIPQNIIDKEPSAELRPGQKDIDSLPDYNVLDKILLMYIEKRMGPEKIIQQGFDPVLVNRILKLVNTAEYKRYQTPPILRVSPKAFGMGRRMPIVGKYF